MQTCFPDIDITWRYVLSVLVQAAITESHGGGGLNNQAFISPRSGVQEVWDADASLAEASCWHAGDHFLDGCSQSEGRDWERVLSCLSVGVSWSHESSLHLHNLIVSPKSHLQVPSLRGLGFQYMNLREHRRLVSLWVYTSALPLNALFSCEWSGLLAPIVSVVL